MVCVFYTVIATSGIDYNVKLWEPVASHEASLSDLDEVQYNTEPLIGKRERANLVVQPLGNNAIHSANIIMTV